MINRSGPANLICSHQVPGVRVSTRLAEHKNTSSGRFLPASELGKLLEREKALKGS